MFFIECGRLLGLLVSCEGIRIDPLKFEVIFNGLESIAGGIDDHIIATENRSRGDAKFENLVLFGIRVNEVPESIRIEIYETVRKISLNFIHN